MDKNLVKIVGYVSVATIAISMVYITKDSIIAGIFTFAAFHIINSYN